MKFNELKTKPKVLLGISAPLLLLIGLGAVVVYSINSINQTSKWVDHTHVVLEEAEHILAAAVDMETGMRGYLLSGKEEFLEPYKRGEVEAFSTIDELMITVSDNPAQVARLKSVDSTLNEWQMKIAEPMIELRRNIGINGSMHQIVDIVGQARGKANFDKFRALMAEFSAEESRLITIRRAENQEVISNTYMSIALFILGALVVGGFMAQYVGNAIAQPLVNLKTRVKRLADGEGNVEIDGLDRIDEIGDLANSVNEINALATVNSRLKSALDNCQANMMVADTDYNIVYMNESMTAMMYRVEAELRKDLPNFNARKIIGGNIDSFHKNPMHQRQIMANIKEAYTTCITIGGRQFDLAASPVLDDKNERIGTVMEWTDITDRLKREAEEKRIADENLRVRTALDNSSASAMIVDNSFDIVYANAAIIQLMSEAEDDIRIKITDFSAKDILGQNMDIFHTDAKLQRDIIEKLDSAYHTRFSIGHRIFDLTANPVVTDTGERLGSVVEWSDVTVEVGIQEEVDQVVSAVASGDFSKSLTLDDKRGFMLNLSKSINNLSDTVENVLENVAAALASMAQGDLTNRITTDYQGTFETIKQDVNQTSERLSGVFSDILTASDEISSASSEVAAGSANLSGRTEQQASSLQETAASMEEMATTVKQNAENAQQANRLSIEARQTAESGGSVVSRAVTSMSKIEESSQKVADIVSVIDEIAFQTNLLALNAAVEAARAGDAGKGFAVVASEVRTLAQRSSEAAKDIKALISDSDSRVKEGVELVNETGESLANITTSVKRVADIISEIAAASKEQASGVEEINSAITSMDEMTQQNAALVEESSSSARSLEDQAETLLDMVNFFKIDDQQRRKKVKKVKKDVEAAYLQLGKKENSSSITEIDEDGWEEF